MNFAYYIFLLLIIFFSILLLEKNLKYSPKKIKIYLTFVIIMAVLRNLTLIILCVLKKANIISILKYFIFLDYVIIPIMVIAITYIFMRWDKIKFIWSYFIAACALVAYFVIIRYAEIFSQVSVVYGFIISLKNQIVLTMFSIVFLGMIIIVITMIMDKPYINKKGLMWVLGAAIIVFIEEIIIISGIKIFPYPVIGEMIFLIIMNYALGIFEKINKSSRE